MIKPLEIDELIIVKKSRTLSVSGHAKMCNKPYANYKDKDEPTHSGSLDDIHGSDSIYPCYNWSCLCIVIFKAE